MAGEIQLNSTTFATESGGTVTLANVDSATNRTNLGLGSMATQAADSVAITGGTIGSGVDLKAAINASGSAPIYACRAWANFNGTGTVAIRDSGNVSSITDNGTGDYTVNFATAMPDANYSVVAIGQDLEFNNFDMGIVAPKRSVLNSAYQTSSITIGTTILSFSTTGGVDFLYVNVAIFR